MHIRSQRGRGGEAIVAHYLSKQGFTILAFNYAKQFGEIDLIASKKSLLVFVEVKMRSSAFDHREELILPSKQRKIVKVAKEFIMQRGVEDITYRFDVAFVEGEGERARITYIEDAFQESW